jgi:hypothetical protein
MTDQVPTVRDPEGDTRWREWQARGTESDRRTAKRMRIVMLLMAAAFAMWSAALLA